MFENTAPPLHHDSGTPAVPSAYHHAGNPSPSFVYPHSGLAPSRSMPNVRARADSALLPPVPNLPEASAAPPLQLQPQTQSVASTAPSGYNHSEAEGLPIVYVHPDPTRFYTQNDVSATLNYYGQQETTTAPFLQSEHIELIIRQQPKEALIAYEGKEKARKPVDPPPILQIKVAPGVDPQQHFLQSPYMFMCTSLYKQDDDQPWDTHGNKSLAGSVTSSLHRLKDVDNKDGGFFVFGDISVKVAGTFRLHFSLFDLRKDFKCAEYLGSVTSQPFKVCLPKDYRGLEESTYLSRAFSDQGVRLRLRKEPRGPRRAYPYSDTPGPNPSVPRNLPTYAPQRHQPYPTQSTHRRALFQNQRRSPLRRFHSESNLQNDETEHYSDHSAAVSTPPGYSHAQYPVPQHTFSPMLNVSLPPGFGLMGNETAPRGQYQPEMRRIP